MTRPLAWLLTDVPPDAVHRFGNHIRFEEFARALDRCGFALRIIAPAAGPRARKSSILGNADYRRHPSAPRLPWAPPGWDLLWFWAVTSPWLHRLARREPPTWIFLHSSRYASVIRHVKETADVPPFVHIDAMGLSSLEMGNSRRGLRRLIARRIYLHRERVIIDSADLVTTVNDVHAATIARLFSPAVSPVVLRDAAEPIDPGRLPPVDLASVGVPTSATTLAFIGQLIHHRLDDLFAAVERIPRRVELRVLIIGAGPDLARYRRQAAASDLLRERVILFGFVQDDLEALALVAACDIAFSDCWSPAGFPIKLFEYMALERAIIIEGKEQMREVLRDGEHAVFYRTVGELADAILALAADEPRRRRLGAAARSLFEARHTTARRRLEIDALMARYRVLR